MTSLPAPTGPPHSLSPRPDPWREQQRRREEHRAARRRRRRRVVVPMAVVAALIGIGAGAAAYVADRSDRSGEAAPATTVTTPSTSSTVPPSTVAPDELVRVGELWLLDLGDGRYDWGITVLTPDGSPTRSGVEATVRLLAVGDEVVFETVQTLDGISASSPVAVAGRLVEPDDAPVRIEFDVGLGVESDDRGLDDLLATRALERDGDVLTGRIRSVAPDDIEELAIVFVWRGAADSAEAGEVIASLVHPVERVRAGVDARFVIDLADEVVPDGLPDEVLWSP